MHLSTLDSRASESAPVPELSLASPPPALTDIAVVGLGYVGLPLSLQFARSGVNVLGLDIDPDKVDALNEGRSYIRHVSADTVADQVKATRLEATTDFARVDEVEAIIICVPTPLNKNREPDISFVLQTGRAIAPHMRKGTLIVLESTTYPGTTDEDLRKILEAESGFKAGEDFHLAFSPEREDPANPESKVGEVPETCWRVDTGLFGKGGAALQPSHQDGRAGFELPRCGGCKAPRKHLPKRKYRPRE